jgi:hypothetical protein
MERLTPVFYAIRSVVVQPSPTPPNERTNETNERTKGATPGRDPTAPSPSALSAVRRVVTTTSRRARRARERVRERAGEDSAHKGRGVHRRREHLSLPLPLPPPPAPRPSPPAPAFAITLWLSFPSGSLLHCTGGRCDFPPSTTIWPAAGRSLRKPPLRQLGTMRTIIARPHHRLALASSQSTPTPDVPFMSE